MNTHKNEGLASAQEPGNTPHAGRSATDRWARRAVTVALAATVAVALAACSSNATATTAAPKTNSPLVVAMEQGALRTLDPNDAYDPGWFIFGHLLYQTLVTLDPTNAAKVIPSLATSYKVNSAGTQYTFQLDPKAKFSDGSAVTSADVVFSMERFINIAGPGAFMLGQVKTVTAPSASTVVFTLGSPDFTFPSILTSPSLGVAEAKTLQAHGGTDAVGAAKSDKATAWLDDHSAGSGPYELVAWTRGQEIQLKANPNYTGPKVGYSQVLFKFAKDANTEQVLLQGGSADIALDLSPTQIKSLASDSKIGVAKSTALETGYLGWTQDPSISPALANPENGTAIKDALDYGSLVSLMNGAGVQAGSVVPAQMEGAVQDGKGLKQDLTAAKKALAAAGNPNGFSFTLGYGSDGTVAGVPEATLAQEIQSSLAKVGIKVDLAPQLSVSFLSDYRAGKLQAALSNWASDYPGTSDVLPPFAPGGAVANRLHWGVTPATKALADAATNVFAISDAAKRAAAIKSALTKLNEVGPYAGLVDTEYQYVYNKTAVTGVVANPLWSVYFEGVQPK